MALHLLKLVILLQFNLKNNISGLVQPLVSATAANPDQDQMIAESIVVIDAVHIQENVKDLEMENVPVTEETDPVKDTTKKNQRGWFYTLL